MNSTLIPITLFCFLLIACSQADTKSKKPFEKINPGLEYRLISAGYGDTVQPGEFLKLHVKQYYNDSLLSDTDSTMAQYQLLDSSQLSKDAYAIFSQVRIADSLVFKVPADSAFKAKRPAFVKKDGWLYTYVKVLAIFRSDLDVQRDIGSERARFQKEDPDKGPM
jgi:hypothetical protein